MTLNARVLRDSFELVVSREPDLTARFYRNLFSLSPSLRPLFGSGPSARQERMLAEALTAVLDHLEDAPWLRQTLHGLGARHVGYGVTEPMYDAVGEALVHTLREVAAASWTDEMERSWRYAYAAIAGLMLEGARLYMERGGVTSTAA